MPKTTSKMIAITASRGVIGKASPSTVGDRLAGEEVPKSTVKMPVR